VNDQMGSPTPASILNAGEGWLTLPFVLIALGVVAALLILWWGARLATRRRQGRQELEERGEVHYAGTSAPAADPVVTAQPAVAPSPPPIADAELPASPPAADAVHDPAPFADEAIAAAAPMDASPASVAASAPAPAADEQADDFTRMKGVGPKLADRLNSLGITRFAQLAALSPQEAATLDGQLGSFQGRLQRDRWIEQATLLAAGDTAGYEAQFGRL
jgi:predicted flap endonuclease-1-like 5' DNA nuclease